MSLWVNEEWWNVPPHGYGWKVEARSDDGKFTANRSGGTISHRAARRAIRRATKSIRKAYRETLS